MIATFACVVTAADVTLFPVRENSIEKTTNAHMNFSLLIRDALLCSKIIR